MVCEIFLIAKKPINHEMYFFGMLVMVKRHYFLSETFVHYLSVPPQFVAVRNQSGDVIDA